MICTIVCSSNLNLKLILKNSSNLHTKHKKIEDLQKSTGASLMTKLKIFQNAHYTVL